MMETAARQAMKQARERGGRMKAELGGVVVLDFGGQYTQLIARRMREQQVFSAVLPCTTSIDEIRKLEPAGIVLSGGPSSVYDADAPKCDPNVLALGIPVLGICYGMQWIMYTLGGTVERAERREYGGAQLSVDDSKESGPSSELFTGIPASLRVWNSHGVEQPRRSRANPPRGISDHRKDRECHCRRGKSGEENLRRRVPPRGEPYRARDGSA